MEHFDITEYFTNISGLNDYYAACKIDLGKKLIDESGLDVGEVLLVGDTVHDYEVAQQIGCDCVLLADRHQSKEKLKTCGVLVLESIREVVELCQS